MADVQVIRTRRQLADFRERRGLRPDWHEPDEREVDVELIYGPFDNADLRPPSADRPGVYAPRPEAGIYLIDHGERVAWVNLAVLLALASGEEEVG